MFLMVEKAIKGSMQIDNFYDKTEYVIHIRKFKQSLDRGLVLKTLHRIIKLTKKVWLKP